MARSALRKSLKQYKHRSSSVFSPPAVELDADTVTLLAAMSAQPNQTRINLINDTIVALKDAGIWSELDELWFFAAHTAQAALLGWKRYKDCSSVGSIPFTTDVGFQRDSGTKYIQTNFNPSSDGVNFLQNDCSFGLYTVTDIAEDNIDMGCFQTNWVQMAAYHAATGGISLLVNASTGGIAATAVDSAKGLTVGRRTASNAQQAFKNGVQVAANSTASGARPNRSVIIGGRDNAGTIQFLTEKSYQFAFFGAALTTDQQADLYDIVTNYLVGIELIYFSQDFDASGSWEAPAGVSEVVVEAWGGGGHGGRKSNGTSAGTGAGGGGAYARGTVPVTPGNTYTVTVGTGGISAITPTAATSSKFTGDNSEMVEALPGASVAENSLVGAAGGSADDSTGDVKFDGGNGANGGAAAGGKGGGGAGDANDGQAGSGQLAGGSGGAAGGGNGGNGGSSGNVGANGSAHGGGGGGAGGNVGSRNGGNGANGHVIISWR